MRRSLAPLPLALLLAACQVTATPPTSPAGSTAPAARRSEAPAPAPKATPASATSAAPGAPPAAPKPGAIAAAQLGTLQAPAAGTVALAGRVQVDAVAFASSKAGRLVNRDGQVVFLAGGVALPGLATGNLVAASGDALGGPAGLRAAEAEGGAFMTAGSGRLIGNDGSTLIGNDGSTLIGNDGSTLIGNDGSTYQLAQAATAATGTKVPAANMLISVVSLRTRAYLPLGTDEQGRPAYAVLTDARGGYTVHVPAGEDQNVLVVAQVPGTTAAGAVLNAVGEPSAAAIDVDPGSSAGAKALRTMVDARIAQFLTVADPDVLVDRYYAEGDVPPALQPLIKDIGRYYHALGKQVGLRADDDPRVAQALASAMGDAVLALVDVREPEVNATTFPGWAGPPITGLALLEAYLDDLEGRAARYLADPTQPGRYRTLDGAWIQAINRTAPASQIGPLARFVEPLRRPDRVIKQPADVLDFALEEYLVTPRDGVWAPLSHLFSSLDGQTDLDDVPTYLRNRATIERMRAGFATVGQVLGFAAYPGPVAPGADPAPDQKAAAACVAAAKAFDLEAARTRAAKK